MDSISQFVLGAFVGEKVLGKDLGKKSLIYGGIVATIPDLDIFMKGIISADPLTQFLWHRSISHSILFALLFPLCAVILFKKKWLFKNYSNSIKAINVYWFFFWCLLTHSLLDCLTNWGTQLFYPYGHRISIASIFIIDLFYTVPFIIAFFWIFCSKKQNAEYRRKIVNYTLSITTVYLLLGMINKFSLEYRVTEALKNNNIVYSNVHCRATPSNIIYWNAIYTQQDKIYASKLNVFAKIDIKNFKLIAESKVKIPNYFYQHPKSKDFLQLLGDTYRVSYNKNGYLIDDFRFNFFYDKTTRKYQSIFSYLISQSDNNNINFAHKSNFNLLRKNLENKGSIKDLLQLNNLEN